MKHCSLSAVLLSDNQDPSLATDISCLYLHFLDAGYHAMGMYLKCLHYLMEAFLDKDASPEKRAFKVSYSKHSLCSGTCHPHKNSLSPIRRLKTSNVVRMALLCTCCLLPKIFPGLLLFLIFLALTLTNRLMLMPG